MTFGDIALIGGAVLIMAGAVTAFLFMQKNSKLSKTVRRAAAEKRFNAVYRFLVSFPLTQGRINAISHTLSDLSVYKSGEIATITVKYFGMATGLQAGIIAAGFLMFGDIFSWLSCLIVALFAGHIVVDRQLEKLNLRVYKQMAHLLSATRQEYLRFGSIPEALNNIAPPPLMASAAAEIEDIMTNSDGELRLMKFYESVPFRLLQTFATICYNINNTGDEIDLSTGHSKFLDSLTLMTSDINLEERKLAEIWAKFKGLIYLPLVPVFCTPIIQYFLRSTMVGTAAIYDGMLGYICNFVTLIATAACFQVVATISRGQGIPEDDRTPIIETLYTRWWGYRKFVINISPKNARKRRLQHSLDAALSRKTAETYTAERVTLSVIGAFICTALLFSSLHYGKKFLLGNTGSMGLTADNSLDGIAHEVVIRMDNDYMAYEGDMEYAEALAFVSNRLPSLSDMEAGDQVKRLQDKKKALAGTNLAWWHFLVVAGCVVGLYFVPAVMLRIRRWDADNAAEEDFLQLQSLMAIISSMGMDTIEALEQLQTNSRIHRHLLLYCYHSYPANPEIELERLTSKLSLPQFKRFIDKMKLTVSDLSLAEAYSDLMLEREHLVRMRETATIVAISRKRNLAGMAAKVPMWCMIGLHAVLPLGYLGIHELGGAMGGIGNL